MANSFLKLILSRGAHGVVVLVVVSALVFALLAAAGGDALAAMYGDPHVSAEVIQSLRESYGLDRPLPARYARWLAGALAVALGWAAALPLAALAARRRGGWADRLSGALVVLASSTPRIVLALVALVAAARWSLFAAGGGTSGARLLLAAIVLAVPLVALFLAQARDGLREALGEEFVVVARAKGLGERRVLLAHAARAALNPLITIFGYSLGGVMSGSVVVETILGWPGLGALSVTAVRSRDVPLLMAVVVVTSTAVLLGNLAADILLRLNDPRVGHEEGQKNKHGWAG